MAQPRIGRVVKRPVGPPLREGVEVYGIAMLGRETGNVLAVRIAIFLRPVRPAIRTVARMEIGLERVESGLRLQPLAARRLPFTKGTALRLVQLVIDQSQIAHPIRCCVRPINQVRRIGHRITRRGQPDVAEQPA